MVVKKIDLESDSEYTTSSHLLVTGVISLIYYLSLGNKIVSILLSFYFSFLFFFCFLFLIFDGPQERIRGSTTKTFKSPS